MKYNLYIQDRNGQSYLEFDSLKAARSELSTRLSFEYSKGSSMSKQGTDNYTVHNYHEGNTRLYIKRTKETPKNTTMKGKLPYHITIAVGNWRNYRVFKSEDALKKYIQAIVDKGYYGLVMDINPKTMKVECDGTTHDLNTMYGEVFDFGLTLMKKTAAGKELKIVIYETTSKK